MSHEFTLRHVLRELAPANARDHVTRMLGEYEQAVHIVGYTKYAVERALLRSHLVRAVSCTVCGDQFNGIDLPIRSFDEGFHTSGSCLHPDVVAWRLEPGVDFAQLMGALRVALDG